MRSTAPSSLTAATGAGFLFSTISCTRACAHAPYSPPLSLGSLARTEKGPSGVCLSHSALYDSSNACFLFSTMSCAHALHSPPLRLASLTSTGKGPVGVYLFHRPPLTSAMGGCFLLKHHTVHQGLRTRKDLPLLGHSGNTEDTGDQLASHAKTPTRYQFRHSAAQAKAASCQLHGLAFHHTHFFTMSPHALLHNA